MSTPAQEAFAEGFAALAEIHATTWIFGGSSFSGVASPIKPDDPRMSGSPDRLFVVEAKTSELSPRPARGDELVRGSTYYRVVRIDREFATGLTTILVAEGAEVSALEDFSGDSIETFSGLPIFLF